MSRRRLFFHTRAARLAVVATTMLALNACAGNDADLQKAEQNVSVARAKLSQDETSGDQMRLAADSKQLAHARFVLKYDRLQWQGDSLGHGANHAGSH